MRTFKREKVEKIKIIINNKLIKHASNINYVSFNTKIYRSFRFKMIEPILA